MRNHDHDGQNIQLELPFDVFCQLLRGQKLAAGDVRYLNLESSLAARKAVKLSVIS